VKTCCLRAALAAVPVVAVSALSQGGIQPIFDIRVQWGANTWSAMTAGAFDSIMDNGDGTWTFSGDFTQTAGLWALEWDVTVDEDPFVNAAFTFTNTTGSAGDFVVTTMLNSADPVTAPSQMSGSISGSLGSGGGVGDVATLGVTSGGNMYNAFVDGSDVWSMVDDSFSLSTTFPATSPFGAFDFGIPTPEAGPAVLNQIGIRHEFSLTNGDSVGINSSFLIVPSGSATPLLLFAGLGAARRRR